tara:strand:+ start:10449 stop:11324 length:876 start_codon:yes stop_codon:yes gene_type:complete
MTEADKIFNDKIEFLLKAEAELKIAVGTFEQRVYNLLTKEYLTLFETSDGIILNSSKNNSLLLSLDRYFNRLEKALTRDILGPFARDLIKSVELSALYYEKLGFKKSIISNLLKDKVRLEQRLGITPTGRLKKEGYLYKLGKTEEVRKKLKDYILSNLTGDTGYKDFVNGFEELVISSKKLKGTTSILEKYFDQYAYDSFTQMDAVANKQIAYELSLQHFIYAGSLIRTSRDFCAKRAGKAFSIKETKKWKDDPTLIGKGKANYRPLIDRGRYRCRHYIKYISKELYDKLK